MEPLNINQSILFNTCIKIYLCWLASRKYFPVKHKGKKINYLKSPELILFMLSFYIVSEI